MAKIALKVDVDTLRGTQEGTPRLAALLESLGVGATFLFSLGPDHTGWALRRVFRPGFLGKVARTSVLEHYGLRTLLYGVLLPGPDIGRRAAADMRAVAKAGFECGIHCWDHVRWQDNVRHRDADWTRAQMQRAWDRFVDVFGKPPATHGAAGWQMNAHALRQLDAWGLRYASDGRGYAPHRVQIGEDVLEHVQLPTTLPTVDELLGVDGLDAKGVARRLLGLTDASSRDQVFTLHAELEGGKFISIFEQLLRGWLAQGHELVTMGEYHRALDGQKVIQAPYAWGSVPGRSGELLTQPRRAAGART